MKTASLALALLATPVAASAALEPHFAPLEFLAGHCWRAPFPDGKQHDVQCYESLYGGKLVKSEHVVLGSEPRYEGTTIFSWDASGKRIRFHYFTSTGAVSEGYFASGADGISIPERHVAKDGKVTEMESSYKPDGQYAYRVVTREKTAKGWVERMNMRYVRSDAPEATKEKAALQHGGGQWRLHWSSNRDGNWEIYRQEADGTATNLTRRETNEWLWSAHDGRLLALSNERADSEPKGWRGVALDGDKLRRLSDEKTGDGFIDCHPSGAPCAVDVYADGKKRRIALFDAQGKRSGLLGDGYETADPQFSADGKRLLFRSTRSGRWELWSADADGSNARQLTSDPANDTLPAHEYGGEGPARFSADGKRIVWMRKFPGRGYDVWTMDADGSNVRNLTADAHGDDSYPSFSPDGAQIAFDSDRDGNNEIYVMQADGSGARRITFAPGSDLAPLWVRAK